MSLIGKSSVIKKKISYLSIITLMLFLMFFINSTLITTNLDRIDSIKSKTTIDNQPQIANSESILFQGTELFLNINDTGTLYNLNQEITVSNQEEENLIYYLDDAHSWEVSKIQTIISDIQDSREWVNNSNFFDIDDSFRIYQAFQNDDPPPPPTHNYSADLSNDPTIPANVHSTISESGSVAMRLHFSRIEIETRWDLLYIYDGNNVLQFSFTGIATDFTTPWIAADTLKITINSDGTVQRYGYDIDYYEFYNESTNYFDFNNSWGYNSVTPTNNFGPGEADNSSAMYVTLVGDPFRDIDDDMGASYSEDDFSEIYQNITIPRGAVSDAYISFDYYAEYAMDSNENYIYCEINNKRVYSKGLGDIVDAGRRIWYSTGKIYMDLWINTSSIFGNIQNNNDFNISVGIMSGASIDYFGFEDRYQQIFWFDNISLGLTTKANSSQNDINLTINGENLIEGNQWGNSNKNFTGIWNINPVTLAVQTNSPSLSFNLDTVLYGFHETTTRVGQTTQEGVSYQIYENGSVYWEFTHNFYMPSQYTDFEFIISKPTNWRFLSVLDPTLQSILFEGGNIGDQYIKINKTSAVFPGWWTFQATSPNFINLTTTKMFKQGQWVGNSFITGESTRIRTQINFSNEIPPNLILTNANLTIYDPTGSIWYQESMNPFSNGTVVFSDITFTALNSIGGQYNYTIFWSNGTALGGIESNFIVNHQSSLTLLKPDDAKLDLRTEGFVGDYIPLRVFLKDAENNLTISNSIISYNWTNSTQYFTESALGIYEAVIDTAELLTRGLYEIIITSSKVGFFESNITLEINLGEETNIQVLESEYNIELHANSTIKFKFSDYTGNGINGAMLNISISNKSLYSITNPANGTYNIEFSTLFIDNVGIYQLSINFSAASYEPQYYIYQFQITKQSVSLNVSVNSQHVNENEVIKTEFNGKVNISVKSISNI
ncbi:MAG: hypothetical protein Lokiarch_39000, partial [Candidatus Lokiarchaeum sp. GC14_75]